MIFQKLLEWVGQQTANLIINGRIELVYTWRF